MIKVLIADDEEKVALLIKNLIDWKSLDMEVVALAKNGTEALGLIQSETPDIVITDIRMPGLDGIELIDKAKDLNPTLEFIIISGYKHFDYAHRAIKYGVSDYLLKPIKEEELTATLSKMQWNYSSRRMQFTEQERNQQHVESGLRQRHSDFIQRLLSPADGKELTIGYVNETWQYNFQTGVFRVVLLKIDGDPDEIFTDGFPILKEKIEKLLQAALAPLCFDRNVSFIGTVAAVLLNYEEEKGSDIRHALKAAFEEIHIHNSLFPTAVFTMAVGSTANSPAGLIASWQIADHILGERLIDGAGTFMDTLPNKGTGAKVTSILTKAVRALEVALETMNEDAVGKAIEDFTKDILDKENITGKDILYLSEMVLSNYVMLAQKYGYSFPNPEHFARNYKSTASVLSSAQNIFVLLRDAILNTFIEMLKCRMEQNAKPVMSAKQYIREHFSETLTLEQIAAKEGFNASYFSTLFKKETGKTFSEYLHDVRMEEAKNLLRNTNMPIALICTSVGYSDLKHFTGSFKKTTGVKPREYRKLYAWSEG
ncbi:hypothetical protein AGMMS49983_14570 [Clostridia bacterium]|nr:hypothetical protein AGMMS49983_14570 [Clostridia bacterium]